MASLWQPRWLALVIAASLMTIPTGVFAQPAEVEARIRQGLELRRQGHDEQAFQVFESVWSTSRSPRARAQMALAAQALGRWADADRFMREALAATGDAWVVERRAVLERSLGEIDARLGLLEVRCNVEGAQLSVDGAERGVIPLREALRLPAGTVTLQVSAPGYVEVIRQTALTAGGTTREQINLVALPRAAEPVGPVGPSVGTLVGPSVGPSVGPGQGRAPRDGVGPIVPPPQEPARTGSLQRSLAWITGGVAVAGLVTGAIALPMQRAEGDAFNALNEDNDRTNDCARGSTVQACVDRESRASTLAAVATTGFVVAGVAAVVSGVLFATLPARREPAHTVFRGCAVSPGRDSVAVGCEITF